MFPVSRMRTDIGDARYRIIKWKVYVFRKVITQDEYICLTSLEHDENKYLEENYQQWVHCILHLLGTIGRHTLLQHLIVKTHDILTAWLPGIPEKCVRHERIEQSHNRINLFIEYGIDKHVNVWRPFMKLLKHEDIVVQRMAMMILAILASGSEHRMPKEQLVVFLEYLNDHLLHYEKNSNEEPFEGLQCVSTSLQNLFTVNDYRIAFANMDHVGSIINVLNTRISPQVQFELISCLWLMSFNGDLGAKMSKYNTISVVAEIFNSCNKEKIFRIILALFRNLLERPTDPVITKHYCRAIIRNKVQRQLSILDQSRYSDEEIEDNIKYLLRYLSDSERDLSSFEEYAAEVRSGRLEWSPVHKSKKFWSKNAHRLNEKNHELLKMLVSFLERHNETTILMVACHDLGEYVENFPKGKKFLEHIKARSMVIQLLSHPDQNVCHEALVCLQKLLVANAQ